MRALNTLLIALATLLLGGCVSAVVIDRQPDSDISAYRSYAFVDQDQDTPRQLDDQRARNALVEALENKGLSPSQDNPDVEVKHFFKREQSYDGSGFQFGLGITRSNVGLGASTPVQGEISEEYKLVVQLIEPASNTVVWQATSRDKLHDEMRSERRETHIRNAVEAMFKQFP